MDLGIVGKPNVGKSTFFRCITDVEAETGNYPFTTVDPNQGVGYVVVDCPCQRLDVECDPTTRCEDGKRFVPVNVSDIAGLVPGASEGKGMGNEFLDNVRESEGLIHVLDCSGRTDGKGEPTEDYSVVSDVEFVEDEFHAWMASLLQDKWGRIKKSLRTADASTEEFLAEELSGLGVGRQDISAALMAMETGIKEWGDSELETFAANLRQEAKPIMYACNKIDIPGAEDNLETLRQAFPDRDFVPMSSQAELTLQRARAAGVVDYIPGDPGFDIVGDPSDEQRDGLETVRELMEMYGGTGVQDVMREAVFDMLGMIVVYPVEDVSRYEDQKGNVLPDAVLLPAESTPVDLAYEIHSDIGEQYAKAVDAETGRAIGKDTALEDGQIVKIEAG